MMGFPSRKNFLTKFSAQKPDQLAGWPAPGPVLLVDTVDVLPTRPISHGMLQNAVISLKAVGELFPNDRQTFFIKKFKSG